VVSVFVASLSILLNANKYIRTGEKTWLKQKGICVCVCVCVRGSEVERSVILLLWLFAGPI
jgi:hypothetical protein